MERLITLSSKVQAGLPIPFLSILVDDCLAKGESVERRRRYTLYRHKRVGLAQFADALAASENGLRGKDQPDGAANALRVNFEGKEYLRQLLLTARPLWNDDDTVTCLPESLADFCKEVLEAHECTGGSFSQV